MVSEEVREEFVPEINQAWLDDLSESTKKRLAEELLICFGGEKGKKFFLKQMEKDPIRWGELFAAQVSVSCMQPESNSDFTTEKRMKAIINLYEVCSQLGTSDNEMAFKEAVFNKLKEDVIDGAHNGPSWMKEAVFLVGRQLDIAAYSDDKKTSKITI